MQRLTLVEHRPARAVPLAADQRDRLAMVPELAVSPAAGREGCYDLTPGSWIGALSLPGLAVEIRPKIAIENVLFLLTFALDPRAWRPLPFRFQDNDDLTEAVAQAFLLAVRRAVRNGLLQGYRSREDALAGVRGRIRLDDQLRRRFGRVPPIEVRFDDYTEDVEPNRLLRAAVERLERLGRCGETSRRELRRLRGALERVTLCPYPPLQLPEIAWDRLNQHYRPAVDLAQLILRGAAFDLGHGHIAANSFLLDMNQIFELFVVTALRHALRLNPSVFPRGTGNRSLYLDHGRAIRLRPDLSWWDGPTCVFAGEIKYKYSPALGGKHPDLYQLLAYTIAAGLPHGMLIYAAGEHDPVTHEVVDLGKRLEIRTLDLSRPPQAILAEIAELATRIRQLRK